MNFLLKKSENLHEEGLELQVALVPPTSSLREAWITLEQESQPPFFLSWAWIGTWLSLLPPELDPQVIEIRDHSQIIGLGLVVIQKKKVFLSNVPTLYLHSTGNSEIDRIYIEHNGLLFAKGKEAQGHRAILRFLSQHPTLRCIYCPGIALETPLFCITESDFRAQIEHEFPSPYVDFKILGDKSKPFLDLVKKSTVRHLRKNIELYSAIGPINLQRAETVDEALSYFQGLKDFHQARFSSKNTEGAFASAFFEKFHTELIKNHYSEGAIDLLLLSAGTEVIGYLYLFRSHGTVYFYQSGFHYHESRQPGLLSHYLAIEYYRTQNLERYDFLAHDAQYKRAFSNADYPMRWISYVKDSPAVRLQQRAFALIRRLRSPKTST